MGRRQGGKETGVRNEIIGKYEAEQGDYGSGRVKRRDISEAEETFREKGGG
jgi:hypothetical protein